MNLHEIAPTLRPGIRVALVGRYFRENYATFTHGVIARANGDGRTYRWIIYLTDPNTDNRFTELATDDEIRADP